MTRTHTVAVTSWPNGSYGILIGADADYAIDPIAVFEVATTSKAKIPGLVIAHLLGADRTHAVMRVR